MSSSIDVTNVVIAVIALIAGIAIIPMMVSDWKEAQRKSKTPSETPK